MPLRAFIDSDEINGKLTTLLQEVLMPLRAFIDSDIYHAWRRIKPRQRRVLMPLRAFIDSDMRNSYDHILHKMKSLNALTGIH